MEGLQQTGRTGLQTCVPWVQVLDLAPALVPKGRFVATNSRYLQSKSPPDSKAEENELALSTPLRSVAREQQGTTWKFQAYPWRKDSPSWKSFHQREWLISAGFLGLFLCHTKVSINRCRISVTKVSWFTSVLEGKVSCKSHWNEKLRSLCPPRSSRWRQVLVFPYSGCKLEGYNISGCYALLQRNRMHPAEKNTLKLLFKN